MPVNEVSIFSINETIKISAMDMKEFHMMFSGRSANAALDFLRELQKASRTYANHFREFDLVKESLVQKCQMIERWCRIRFYKEHMPRYLHIGLSSISAKAIVRKEWEDYFAKRMF